MFNFSTTQGDQIPVNSKSEHFFATDQGDAYKHTVQTAAVNNINIVPTKSQKPLFSELATVHVVADVLEVARLSQYSGYFLNVLVHFRKADLIYPFHYFW